MDSPPRIPKLFLFSAGGVGAAERLTRSIEHGYSSALEAPFGGSLAMTGDASYDRLRAWGSSPNTRNLSAWRAIQPGDLGLGYAEGRFLVVGRLAAKTYSPRLAEQFWGHEAHLPRSLLYFLEDVQPLELERELTVLRLGYSPDFVPGGLIVPGPEHQLSAMEGSPEDLARFLERGGSRILYAQSPRVADVTADLGIPGPAVGRLAEPESEPTPLPAAYTMVKSPGAVVCGEEFELTIGLSDKPQSDVGADQQVRHPEGRPEYTLTMELLAPDFYLRDGEAARLAVGVAQDKPFPSAKLHLRAKPIDEKHKGGLLQVIYSVDNETIGLAVRAIGIAREDRFRPDAEEPAQDPSFGFTPPSGEEPADITVRIARGKSDRELVWTMETAWPEEQPCGKQYEIDVGSKPETFAKDIVEGVGVRRHKPDLGLYISNISKKVGAKIPGEFWRLLREIGKRKQARPTVLILTTDPYVPWELGRMSAPLVDPDDAAYLAAQACVGRWVLGAKGIPAASPPRATDVADAAVVTGKYTPPLVHADAEAEHLRDEYKAREIAAALDSLVRYLEEDGAANLLHFAVHGRYAPGAAEHGLVMPDGGILSPDVVSGADLPGCPFVFLNACQVGSSEEVLGDYAGMAAAFVLAGASAVVAPLWSVNDELASEIAISFYDRAFQENVSPAEYFREQRAPRGHVPDTRTRLAYQFHGHPAMRLKRT